MINIFSSYIHYLIHPFKTHEQFLDGSFSRNQLERLGVYESLAVSWLCVLINSLFRIIILMFIVKSFFGLMSDEIDFLSPLFDINQISSFNLLILSSILDVIFFPVFGIIFIQFWEVLLKFYAKLLQTEGDIEQKAHDILSVAQSSKILDIVPFLGSAISSFVSLILMYAGLRVQLKASPTLSVCILLTPILIMGFMITILSLIIMSSF